MNPAVADLVALIRKYKILSSKGSISNELTQQNPAALGFFSTRIENHMETYKGLSTLNLNPIISQLHEC